MGTVESLALFLPETVLAVTVLALIFFDLLAVAKTDAANATGWVALGGVIVALGASLAQWGQPPTMLFGKMIVFDAFAVFFKVLLSLSLVAAILMSLTSREVAGKPNEGEYYTLLVSSGLGMLLMAGAGNLTVPTIIAASAVVLTAGYMLWAMQRMYLGAPNPKYADKGWEINGRELATLIPLAIIVMILGVYPHAVLRLQSPRLIELNQQVVKAAGKAAPAKTHVADGGVAGPVAVR